ncbi:MAG: hypothetical protein QOG93_2042 [Gaiellaceae bacterium]|jgi:hypothetical protein|nr:hypothetical protein [Gaiellaceae bacterium]
MLVALRADQQQGQITIAQLRDCGLGRNAVAVRVRNGSLHRMYLGVYAVGHAGVTREGRFMAAVLACGDRAYLSWFAAGMLLEYLPWEERLPEVTVVATKARTVHGVRVHRARSLHWRDVTHHHGIPVTSPERTLLDLATVLSPDALRSAARRAQAAYQVSVPQLLAVIERSKGHPGTGALRAVVADGSAPTRTKLEDRVLDLLDAAGIERPEMNASLRFEGITIIPDYMWRDRKLAIEADSERWHEHKLVREHDADKQAILEARGWRVLRIDYQQVERRPQQTLARIRAALSATL